MAMEPLRAENAMTMAFMFLDRVQKVGMGRAPRGVSGQPRRLRGADDVLAFSLPPCFEGPEDQLSHRKPQPAISPPRAAQRALAGRGSGPEWGAVTPRRVLRVVTAGSCASRARVLGEGAGSTAGSGPGGEGARAATGSRLTKSSRLRGRPRRGGGAANVTRGPDRHRGHAAAVDRAREGMTAGAGAPSSRVRPVLAR